MKRAVAAAVIVVGAGTLFLCAPGPGPRSLSAFEPERIADLEVGMWRAYYHKEKLQLAQLLMVMLREQYHYSWARSLEAGFHLARAAAVFGDATGDYDRVLPDLERAFTIARDWTGSDFDPARVARAELAWWVARRLPAERDPENVGRLIAVLYAEIYRVPVATVLEAGTLRARAAALRDEGGERCDWDTVSDLLRQSFRSLHRALHQPPVGPR